MARPHSWNPRPWLALLLVLPLPALAAPQAEQAIRARYRCLGRFDAQDITALFFNQAPPLACGPRP